MDGQYIGFRSKLLAERTVNENIIFYKKIIFDGNSEINSSEIDAGETDFDLIAVTDNSIIRLIILRREKTVWIITAYTENFTAEELAEKCSKSDKG